MKTCLMADMALSVLLCIGLGLWPVAAAADLDNSDCIKCHAQVVAEVETRGLRHKTAVTCLDCHLEHPPPAGEAIPACSSCHAPETKPHYALQECMICHNPHAPLQMEFDAAAPVTAACRSCHGAEGDQLADYPSLHSELDCTACHTEHGSWLSCLECHAGHGAEMTYETCLRCHQPHRPTVVRYDDHVPNAWCSDCHGGVVDTLAENRTKHHDLACVYCHKYQHRLVPNCETCHGEPHGVKMHRKYPDCRECHTGPHALDK